MTGNGKGLIAGATGEQWTDQQLTVVAQVGELRLMTGRQLQLLHYPDDRYSSHEAAARAARRSLERLVRERLLGRRERRIGGVRAGSASFVYGIGPAGERLLGLTQTRRHRLEPAAMFVTHTLAVAELVVDLTLAARAGHVELLVVEAEPDCWRAVPGFGTGQMLRPDLFVMLGVGDFEHRFFVEVDRGSEHGPALLRKCRLYDAYYRSGTEQEAHGVFPRVLWLVPDERRLTQLRGVIEGDRYLTDGLFVSATFDRVIEVITGGAL